MIYSTPGAELGTRLYCRPSATATQQPSTAPTMPSEADNFGWDAIFAHVAAETAAVNRAAGVDPARAEAAEEENHGWGRAFAAASQAR